jgi:hypothetical protein
LSWSLLSIFLSIPATSQATDMPRPLLDPQHQLPEKKPNRCASRVQASGKNLMFIISNYTINLIGYPGKYHACEIEAATMGSRLTTRAYYLIVLGARHSVCSREIASSDSLTNRAQSISALHRYAVVDSRKLKGGDRVSLCQVGV